MKNKFSIMRKVTHTNFVKEEEQLNQEEHRIKGYVKFLRRKSLLDLEEMNKQNIQVIKRKNYGSSNNLRIKRENQKKKETKKSRRLSYTNEENRKVLFSSPNIKKIKKTNSLKPEFAFDYSKKKMESPRTRKSVKSLNPKLLVPKKSFTHKIKSSEEKNNMHQKKQQEKKELFSILKKPEYFEGENNDSDSIVLDNSDQSHLNMLSNKNILQLNEITKELKNTFLGKGNKNFQNLNKKSFILDDIEKYERTNNSENNSSNFFEKEIYRVLSKKGYVYDSFDEEELLDEEIEIYHNLNPDSNIVNFKDFLIFLCVFYNLLYLPIFLAYNNIYCYFGNYFSLGNIVENLIDLIYLFDIIITFFIGFYNFDEILINDYKSIAKHYFKSWFVIDVISAIPIKTLLTIFNKKCYNKDFLNNPLYNHNYYYLLILIRLFKTLKLIFKNKFIQYLDLKLNNFDKFNQYFRLFMSLTIFLFSIHLVACIYIFIGKNEFPNWIINFNHKNKNFHELYLISIYYTIETVTTVGYGDIFCTNFSEKIFGIIMEIFGIIAYSWSLTAMINYVKTFTDKEEELCKKLRILDDIKLIYPKLSEDLHDRISRFLKYIHEYEKKDSHIVFDDLPVTLRNSLIYEMYKPMIKSFIFFKNFSNSDFIVKIILALKPILALKNDVLIKDGDFVEDIIFVKKGKLSLELPLDFSNQKLLNSKKSSFFFNKENTFLQFKTNSYQNFKNLNVSNTIARVQTVENKDNIQHYRVLQIRKNEHFGDILMFLNQRSPLILKVKSKKAELFFLNKSDAINISTIYPQYWKRINKKSLFNMEQIKRCTNKLIKIIKNISGNKAHVKKHIRRVPSVLTGSYIDIIEENNDCDLKSIPTFNEETEINNSIIYDDIKNLNEKENNYDRYGKQVKNKNQLKTIVEDEIYSSSSQTSNSSSSKKSSSVKSSSLKSSNLKSSSLKSSRVKSSSLSSDFLSSNFSNSKISSSLIQKKNNNTFKEDKNDIEKNYKKINIANKASLTPYTEEEINNEIYPEETFIITGGSNNKYNKSTIINNFFQNKINISICSTESFSISSEYENIDELSERRYSKDKKLRKKVKNFIKEEILKSVNSKSTLSENSESENKDSSHNTDNNKKLFKNFNKKKKSNEYKKICSSLNPIPKRIEKDFGFGIKGNNDKEDLIRNHSGIHNLIINKMLSEDDEKNLPNKKEKEKEKDILDVIGHNIEKNVMILNNPEQFYSEFFINVINKKNNHSSLKKDEVNYKYVNNFSLKDKTQKKKSE